MFLAALLDPVNAVNAAKLHKDNAAGFAHGSSVTFPGADITSENREHVKDFDRQPGPMSPTIQIGAKARTITEQMLDLVGTSSRRRCAWSLGWRSRTRCH